MYQEAALLRACELLRPGGVLAVIGCARDSSASDALLSGIAVLWNRLLLLTKTGHLGSSQCGPPPLWPPPLGYREVRQLAERALPGVQYRRLLLWRYSLIWKKPE